MILKKIKILLITANTFVILLSSSAFSPMAYATGKASSNITPQITNVTNKNTVDWAELQHHLNSLFNAGLIEDNIRGAHTNDAINKYGPILGSTDPTNLLQLTEQILIFPICKQGSKGASVGYIQYKVGAKVDRDFGPITVKKVEAFQKLKGLTSNGIVDAATWDKLIN